MLHRFLFFGFLLQALQGFSQDKLLARIDTPAVSISIDNLDNIYIVSDKNELLKYNQEGMLLSSYSNKNLGKEFSVDVSDPLRIVLYSSAFQQLILLNKQLAEIFSYRFKDISRHITLLAGASDNNGFWIFDESAQQLYKLTKEMKEEYFSDNIFQLTGNRIRPTLLQVSGQYVYLYAPKAGLLQFDRFGAYIKTIPEKGEKLIGIKGNSMVYLRDDELRLIDIRNSGTSVRKLPPLPAETEQTVLGSKIMALSAGGSVFIFSQ